MKKLALFALLSISAFAWDIASTAKAVGGAMGITAESLGGQLYEVVKTKAPSTTEQAKSYCTQASTYKQFVGVADDGMMAKAIDVCSQKASENLTTTTPSSATTAAATSAANAANDAVKKTTDSATSSVINSASKLLGN